MHTCRCHTACPVGLRSQLGPVILFSCKVLSLDRECSLAICFSQADKSKRIFWVCVPKSHSCLIPKTLDLRLELGWTRLWHDGNRMDFRRHKAMWGWSRILCLSWMYFITALQHQTLHTDPERTEKKTLTRCQHLVVEPLDPKGHVSIYSSTPSLKNSITVVKCIKGTQLILHLFCKSETKQY